MYIVLLRSKHGNCKLTKSTLVEIRAVVVPTTKNATSKNHPKDILRYKITFTEYHNAFKTRKELDIEFLKNCKNSKFCLNCLTA